MSQPMTSTSPSDMGEDAREGMKDSMISLEEALRDFEQSGKLFEQKGGHISVKQPPPLPLEKGLLVKTVERIVALIAAVGLIATGGALKACSKGLAKEGSAIFSNGTARAMETDIAQNINRTVAIAWKKVGGGFFRRPEMRMEPSPPNINIKGKPKTSSNETSPIYVNISGLLSNNKPKEEDRCPSVDIETSQYISRKYCEQEAQKRSPYPLQSQ